MRTVAQAPTKRNEGGRYSVKSGSDWYKAIEAERIAEVEDAERALVTALATQVGNAISALPEAAERIRKAAKLVQDKQVWKFGLGNFLVGASDPEKVYLVRRHPLRCECPDATHRERLCKHALSVAMVINMGAAYQARY